MNNKFILSKESSLILRGVAIMAIMLHNFLHNPQLGFSLENEMAYKPENALHFFEVVGFKGLNVYELLSFLGWTGVVVFVFLTGYGVAKNPPPTLSDSYHYVRRQYLKLLALLLPAMAIFIIGDAIQHNLIPTLLKRISYITMMANIAYPWVKCPPGVYWYFGFTFQLYLLYAFLGKYLNGKNLLFWGTLSIICLAGLCSADMPEILSVYKHCFTGWFAIFAIGLWLGNKDEKEVAKYSNHSMLFDIMLIIISAFLVFWMNKWMVMWLLVPFAALVMFVSIGLVIMRSIYLSAVFKWIGQLSAFIFVCHPIVRFVINRYMLGRVDNLLCVVFVYVISTIIIAVLYQRLYKRLFIFVNNN